MSTNRAGQSVTRASGALLDIDVNLTRVGSLPKRLTQVIGRGNSLADRAPMPAPRRPSSLPEADILDAMAADGWRSTPTR